MKKFFKLPNNIGLLVVGDVAKRFWPIYLLIGVFSALILVSQAAGLANILHIFSGNSSFSLPLHLQKFFPLLTLNKLTLLLASSFLLILSLIITFISRKLIVNMMIKYESICAGEIIKRVLDHNPAIEDKNDKQIITLLSKDCRFGGRIAQELSNIVMPLGALVVALPIMFYINFFVTVILLVVLFLTTLTYGWLARRAYRISSAMETGATSDSQLKKQLVSDIQKKDFDLSKTPLPNLPHQDFVHAYNQRLMMPYLGLLIGGIQLTLSLTIMASLIVEGNGLLFGGSVSAAVLYGFLAVFTLSQLRTTSKVFANFHVFLNYFQRAFVIIKGLDSFKYGIITSPVDIYGVPPADEDEIL